MATENSPHSCVTLIHACRVFHDFYSWLRLIAHSMQWNPSCETHKLLWILNFHSYSPGSATVLSQFKFHYTLSCKLLKQSNLLSFHSLPDITSNTNKLEATFYTGRFIMFSVITNIYNKKTKGPTLMELFTATG